MIGKMILQGAVAAALVAGAAAVYAADLPGQLLAPPTVAAEDNGYFQAPPKKERESGLARLMRSDHPDRDRDRHDDDDDRHERRHDERRDSRHRD